MIATAGKGSFLMPGVRWWQAVACFLMVAGKPATTIVIAYIEKKNVTMKRDGEKTLSQVCHSP